jgi:hypothetical protein
MATGVCLPKESVAAFKQALVSGKITPEKLSTMTSEARHQLFSEVVGKGEAKWVNSAFESKLLLKDTQRGMLTWAKKLTGVTPEVRRDITSRILKLDERILNPGAEEAFLKDLAETKLGMGVSVKEAKQIANMGSRLQELEAKRRPDNTFPSKADRMAYGYAKVDMGAYLADLKNAAEKPTLKESLLHPGETTSKVAGISKAIRASLDNSALFRQGWKTVFTNPVIWQRNARASFKNLYKVGIQGKDVTREVMADIVSRPNYDKYSKMKLAIGNIEEAYPTSLPEKVPILGRAYKASEQAYEAFLYKTRADIADKMLQVAEKTGVDTADKTQLTSIGKMINALTGRGHLGRFENGEAPATFNNVFFSIRFVKSNLDTLTAHQLQKGVTPFVRKQAATNLVKVVMGTAAVLAIADHLQPGSVEWDPRSKDFGKIKLGHTRFDVSGGMGSVVTLAAQLISNKEKSTSTGIMKKFGDGFGASTGVDALNNYFENKLSPAASVVKDLIQRKDFNGNPVTVKGEAKNLLVPMPITTNLDAKNDPHSANKLLIAIADGLGVSTNTYGGSQKSFDTSLPNSNKLKEFKQHVGEVKYREAEKRYNAAVDKWMADHQSDLNKQPNDERTGDLNTIKSRILKNIYNEYGFKYTPPKPSGSRKSLFDSANNYK